MPSTYSVDGTSKGCPAPYFQCMREADAKAREKYIRDLERLRDAAKPCIGWPGAGGDGSVTDWIEEMESE